MNSSPQPLGDSLDLSQLRTNIPEPFVRPSRVPVVLLVMALIGWLWISPALASYPDRISHITFPFVLISVIVWGVFFAAQPTRYRNRHDLKNACDMLYKLVPDLPKTHPSQFLPLFTWELPLGVCLSVLTNLILIYEPYFFVTVIGLWLGLLMWMTRRFALTYRQLEVQISRRTLIFELLNQIWRTVKWALLYNALAISLWGWILGLGIFFLCLSVLHLVYLQFILNNRILAPLYNASYETAINRLPFAQFIQPHVVHYFLLEASLLFELKPQDSDQVLFYPALFHVQCDVRTISLTLIGLGDQYLEKHRWLDALRLFEGAAKLSPARWTSYAALADWYLLQRVNGNRALELVDLAADLMKTSSGTSDRVGLSFIQGKMAQAAALAGRNELIPDALTKAAENITPNMLRELARLAYVNGYVADVQHDAASARQHYQRALELDPRGTYGRTAAKLLQRLDG